MLYPGYLLPQLPSQNTVLDCLFLILLSTILHPWTIHFKTKLRPKGPKNLFSLRTAPPLSQGLDDRLTLILRSGSSTDFNCTDFLSLMMMNRA